MPLFDAYIMTDWSGGSRRRKNRRDAIWIAHGDIEDDSPQTQSPSSRTEAIELIRSLLHEWVTNRSRVLVCFDFAYGYPVDFAAALESATGKSDLPWRLVWQYRLLVLRAAMCMARLWRAQGKRDEARELLAPVYGWFTEGFNTRDLKEAKALLDELSSLAPVLRGLRGVLCLKVLGLQFPNWRRRRWDLFCPHI